jgi:hypothetical protein
MHQQTTFCSITTSNYGVMGQHVFSHIAPWWKKTKLDRNCKGAVHISQWVPNTWGSSNLIRSTEMSLSDDPTNGKTISPHFFRKARRQQTGWKKRGDIYVHVHVHMSQHKVQLDRSKFKGELVIAFSFSDDTQGIQGTFCIDNCVESGA